MHSLETVHATVSCDFCGSPNELTMQNVGEMLEIHCSSCGAPLGKVKDLQRIANDPKQRPQLRIVS